MPRIHAPLTAQWPALVRIARDRLTAWSRDGIPISDLVLSDLGHDRTALVAADARHDTIAAWAVAPTGTFYVRPGPADRRGRHRHLTCRMVADTYPDATWYAVTARGVEPATVADLDDRLTAAWDVAARVDEARS